MKHEELASVACYKCGETYAKVPMQDNVFIDVDVSQARIQHLLTCQHNGANREFAKAKLRKLRGKLIDMRAREV